jgi:hypothetical protein
VKEEDVEGGERGTRSSKEKYEEDNVKVYREGKQEK